MKALVLSGGSIKGAWQAGAIRAVLEKGFYPEIITGISVGALNGAFIVNQTKDAITYNAIGNNLVKFWQNKITKPSDLVIKKKAITIAWEILRKKFNGSVSIEPLKKIVHGTINADNIANSSIKYFCGYVNLESGDILYINPSVNLDYILASAAIPFIMPTANIGSRTHIDGGVRDSAPLKKAIDCGATQIICIATSPEKLEYSNENWGDILKYGDRLMDIISNNTLNDDIKQAELINSTCPDDGSPKTEEPFRNKKYIKLKVIRPLEQINVTLSNFDKNDIKTMIDNGYLVANQSLQL